MPTSSPETIIDRLQTLVAPGVLGFYTHCEVTELFADIKGVPGAHNVFTIMVLEHRGGEVDGDGKILNPKRLTLNKLANWSFGIYRYTRPLGEMFAAITTLCKSGAWAFSGHQLAVADLVPLGSQFVPPNQRTAIPMNRVLKNNFWNGSQIFEWADSAKSIFQPLFDNSDLLPELSDAIRPFVPIDIAALADRLGNLVIQLPVTVITSDFSQCRQGNDYRVRVGWHPVATPRPVRASVEIAFDETVTGYASRPIEGEETILPMPIGRGDPRGIVWDEANGAVLGATGALSYFNEIRFSINLAGQTEPREFSYLDADNRRQTRRIALRGPRIESGVGAPRVDENGGFTQRRIFKQETDRVAQERLFVQYGLENTDAAIEHERALQDLRLLIARHGEEGAWLWDPYLSAIDLLQTLFHSPHPGADLRGLSGRKSLNRQGKVDFMATERQRLEAVQSNWQSFRLEFRAVHSIPNAKFHDRFLIFPRAGQGDLAWSLGTSVNDVGKAHHILQQVDDGQRVSNAFTALWDRLRLAHLVWKHP